MSAQRFYLRVDGGATAPKPPRALPVVVIAVFAILAWVIAAVSDKPGVALVLALAGGWLALLAAGIACLMHTVERGVVRAVAQRDGVTLMPSRILEFVMYAVPLGALLMWMVLVSLLFRPDAAETFSGLPMRAALVGLPAAVAISAWTFRSRRGLTLSPDGLTGVKFATRLSLDWDDIEAVQVHPMPGRGQLVIVGPAQRSVRIDAAYIGSDAEVVAHMVRHFVDHRQDRDALLDGVAALGLFDARELPRRKR